MEGWFNAKELMAALEKAIEWTNAHGDENPFVAIVHHDNNQDRVRVLVGFDDGEVEFTGFNWDRVDPTHFPYSYYSD